MKVEIPRALKAQKKTAAATFFGGALMALGLVQQGAPLCGPLAAWNPVAGAWCKAITFSAAGVRTQLEKATEEVRLEAVDVSEHVRELPAGPCQEGDTRWRPSGAVCSCIKSRWVDPLDGGAEGCGSLATRSDGG